MNDGKYDESDEEFYAIEQKRREKALEHQKARAQAIADEAVEILNYGEILKLDMPELNSQLEKAGIFAENITWLNKGQREEALGKALKEFRIMARIAEKKDAEGSAKSELYKLWTGRQKEAPPEKPMTDEEFRAKHKTIHLTTEQEKIANEMKKLSELADAKRAEIAKMIAGGMAELSPEVRDKKIELTGYENRIQMMKDVINDQKNR